MAFGAGGVGFGEVAGRDLDGAELIICVDLSPERLGVARGDATETWEGGPGTVHPVLDESRGFGAGYAFVATGW